MKVLIAAGGTGGHIYPGIAIAKAISEYEDGVEIRFVGTDRGMEKTIVPNAGYQLETIRVKGFARKLSMDTLKSAKELVMGMLDAKRLIKNYHPDVVIGMGGYVCGPVLLIASRMRIPTIIHEQNAFPGATNKLLSRFVDKVAISFPEAKEYFRDKDKVFLSGNPVRKEFFETDKKLAREKFGFSEGDFVIVSAGGSLGAASINNGMLELIKDKKDDDKIRIIHITGKANYESFLEMLKQNSIDPDSSPRIKVLPYSDHIYEIYACADLVVSRAGAMSVAELSATGTPAVLIPYPYATDNHQEFNARSLTDNGGGVLMLDSDLKQDPGILRSTVDFLMENPEKLNNMKAAASKKAIPQSDVLFYKEMKKIIRSGKDGR